MSGSIWTRSSSARGAGPRAPRRSRSRRSSSSGLIPVRLCTRTVVSISILGRRSSLLQLRQLLSDGCPIALKGAQIRGRSRTNSALDASLTSGGFFRNACRRSRVVKMSFVSVRIRVFPRPSAAGNYRNSAPNRQRLEAGSHVLLLRSSGMAWLIASAAAMILPRSASAAQSTAARIQASLHRARTAESTAVLFEAARSVRSSSQSIRSS